MFLQKKIQSEFMEPIFSGSLYQVLDSLSANHSGLSIMKCSLPDIISHSKLVPIKIPSRSLRGILLKKKSIFINGVPETISDSESSQGRILFASIDTTP